MPMLCEKVLTIIDDDYQKWLVELKKRYQQSQIKAASFVNSELLRFNWALGKDIVEMKGESRWGRNFYASLSKDLQEAFPDCKGFSVRNLHFMRQFYELFPDIKNVQQVVSQIVSIPWGHIIQIINKVRGDSKKALFYINKTIEIAEGLLILLLLFVITLSEPFAKTFPDMYCGLALSRS